MHGGNLTEARNGATAPLTRIDTPQLTFMLARQAMTRWGCDVGRLADLVERGRPPASAAHDLELAARQVATLMDRMRPLAESADLPVRFEAQEVLAALARLETAVWRLRGRLDPGARRRTPAQVVAALTKRSAKPQARPQPQPPLHFMRM